MKKTMFLMLIVLSVTIVAQNSEMQKSYFDKRLKEVNSLVPLNLEQKQELSVIYQDKCKNEPEEDGEWAFRIALSKVVKDTAKIHIIYQKEIEQSVAPARLKYELNEQKIRYQLTDDQVNSMQVLMIERRKAFRILDFIYPDNIEGKIIAEKALSDLYSKKLTMAYTRLGVKNSLMNSATVLKYKKELSLTPEQFDKLLLLGWKISKELSANIEDSQRLSIEYSKTKEILSKEQYELFLECKVKEIEVLNKQKAKLELDNIKIKKQLGDDQVKLLEGLITEKIRANKKLEFVYPDKNSEERIKAEKVLADFYGKKLEMTYTRMGVKSILMNSATALKYIKELSLKPEQLDELSLLGWKLSKELPDTIENKDRYIIEHKRTQEILTENQYDNFLKLKVKNNVQKDVQSTWKEMKKYNMTAEVDSTTACNAIHSFYMEKALINIRYDNMANGEDEKIIKQQNLNELRPSVLKKLSVIKNRENKKTALQPNALTW